MAERRKNRKRKDVSVAYGREIVTARDPLIVRHDRSTLNAIRITVRDRSQSVDLRNLSSLISADPSDVDTDLEIPMILLFRVMEHEFTDDREFTAHI